MKLAREEFHRLALEQLDTLYRLARRLTGNPNRAEDLVQETYLRALAAAGGFDLQQYGIRPWLVRIMHNLYVSRGEREGRQPKALESEYLESAANSGGASVSPAALPPINLASFDAMDERLVGALQALPSEYQSVLLLWAVEDFSYKEIADALDIPIGTVMSRLYRARSQLSEKLGGKPPE